MARSPLVGRLLSPTGFVLVLLTFLLPFLAVACDVKTGEQDLSFSATFTGVDLVVGGAPTVRSSIEDQRLDEAGEPIDPQPLAIAAVVVLGAGIAVALIRSPVIRLAAGAGTGVVGAAMIFAGEFQARSVLEDLVRPSLADLGGDVTADDLVRTRYGFWLALLLALLVALGNAVALTRALTPADDEDSDEAPLDPGERTDQGLAAERTDPGLERTDPGLGAEPADQGLWLFDDRRD